MCIDWREDNLLFGVLGSHLLGFGKYADLGVALLQLEQIVKVHKLDDDKDSHDGAHTALAFVLVVAAMSLIFVCFLSFGAVVVVSLFLLRSLEGLDLNVVEVIDRLFNRPPR